MKFWRVVEPVARMLPDVRVLAVRAPAVRVPMLPLVEKRLVEDAVVLKIAVPVALV